jgi:hypothetical protein
MIAFTKGIYNGFYNSWCILLLPFLAAGIPSQFKTKRRQHLFYFILFLSILSGIVIQYRLSSHHIIVLEEKFKTERQFYDEILNTLIKTNSHYFTFLINENYAIFYDHSNLNRHIPLKDIQITGFMSVHDSYYQLQYKDAMHSIEAIAKNIMHSMEQDKSPPLVIAYCLPSDILKSKAFEVDGNHIAIPVALAETDYLTHHADWHIIKTVHSPFGCVNLYQFLHQ